MRIEGAQSDFFNLIDPDTEIELIAEGFKFTEGPVWNSRENQLYFSDIPANTIYSWSESEGLKKYRAPSNFSNGLTFSPNGNLIICEHKTRSVAIKVNGTIQKAASTYKGKRLNSPNDVVCAKDGSIFFSDPIYGLRLGMGGPAEQELDFQGVYRVPPNGSSPVLITDSFERPNGLAFTNDESRLYITDTVRQHIRLFHPYDNWNLHGGEIWAELWDEKYAGRPDGLKVDNNGNVFCTGPGGIWVFSPAAVLLGRIYLPEKTANLAWGEDGHSLFITSSSNVYRMRCLTAGTPPMERFNS